ncbi:MAG: peptidylprolyl isomerase [Acidobacteria bacterium]|nr:peptidylprolyl isomerase [Acidobacteriota bacterium]
MISRRILRALVPALGLALGGCSRYLTAGAALVNGVSIPQSEVDRRIAAYQSGAGGIDAQARVELTRQVVVQLVEEELVRQEVERRRIAVADSEVARRIEELRARFATAEDFDRALAKEQLDMEGLRERVRSLLAQERLKKLLAAGNPVTGAEVRRAYEASKVRYQEFRVRQMVFLVQDAAGERTALAKAQSAVVQVGGGADFAALARRFSEDPQTRARGGDLGFQTLENLPPQVAQEAARMKVGAVSNPVRGPAGYLVLRLDAKRTTPFADVAAELRAQMESQRLDQALSDWFARAFSRASIIVNPRYGDWEPQAQRVVPHQFFVPGAPQSEETPFGHPPVPGAP